MYDALFRVTDDDAGTGTDTVKILITGDPSESRGAGYWQHQYRGNGKIDFTTARLNCFLEISAFLSDVFNEVRDASTIAKALQRHLRCGSQRLDERASSTGSC